MSNKYTTEMNSFAIGLVILVIVLVYILYRFFGLQTTELVSTASLTGSNPPIPIKTNPMGTRYAYGIWVYVNSWDTSVPKTIYGRDDNIKLYLDQITPTLKCDITMNKSTQASPQVMTVEITDSFPLQKWTQLVVSVDNQYLDAYLDGKLIKSARIYKENADSNDMPKVPIGTAAMNLGSGFDAYVSKFKHWSLPVNPQVVWSSYMEGNGGNGLQSYVSSYGINLSILKDNVEQSKYRLF
jgi:hypothetical protein